MKNIRGSYLKFFVFLEVKFSTYLHRRVFVMGTNSYNYFIEDRKGTYIINKHNIDFHDKIRKFPSTIPIYCFLQLS